MLLAVFSIVAFFIVLPYAKRNISESGINEHYRLYREERDHIETSTIQVPLYSGNEVSYKARELNTLGRDKLHLMIEALLLPLSDEEISDGFSTAIPEKTKLIGVSEKNGYFFIELSKSFTEADDIEKALLQFHILLDEYKEVKELTVLSDGELIRENEVLL